MGHRRFFFATHCESQSVDFFLLGSDAAYYVDVGDISVFVNLVSVYEKHVSVSSINPTPWNICPI